MRIPYATVVPVLLASALVAQKARFPESMDFGPCLMTTFDGGGLCGTTEKGLVIRLGDRGAVSFDTELLRMSVAWTDGWLRLRGTAYDGSHGPFPSRAGNKLAETGPGPGWSRGGSFDDPRPIPHGPLPSAWGKFGGHSRVGDEVVIDYRLGDMFVREMYALEGDKGQPMLVRTLELGPSKTPQQMVVLEGGTAATSGQFNPVNGVRAVDLNWQEESKPEKKSKGKAKKDADAAKPVILDRNLLVVLHGSEGPTVATSGNRILMSVPAHDKTLRVQLVMSSLGDHGEQVTASLTKKRNVTGIPLGASNKRWDEKIVTKGVRGTDDGPFAVDTITIPFENPWGSRMRTGAFDFFSDGRAAVSTWNGDVWIVSGIDDSLENLEWQRFATGLFDPLGLRIVNDVVFVHGRDGLTRLIDINDDGEADRYECFNNQIYITAAFHEFAFDLQTDKEGNFYFTKGAPVNPGGRGFMKIVPHHGTILKVSADGSTIETVATGMRAPNGIGVSPDGIITSGDNEGTYMPRCRLNWIEKPGYYAGVKDTAHRTPVPDQPDLPLCWMPMDVDNSSGGQVWVTGSAWQDLQGRLLHNSYGTCSTYLVLSERINGQMQGGVVRLPANYSSSCMRGRFSPIDGEMYVIGLKGWQTSAAREGGFHRVRRTSRPLDLPVALSTCEKGVYLTFSDQVDAEVAADAESFGVEIWNYRYSQNYGSPEISILHPERKIAQGKPNRDSLQVTSSKLSSDGRTVFLAIEGMRPVHQMKITWDLDSKDGRPMRGELHNTIHNLQKDPGFPKAK